MDKTQENENVSNEKFFESLQNIRRYKKAKTKITIEVDYEDGKIKKEIDDIYGFLLLGYKYDDKEGMRLLFENRQLLPDERENLLSYWKRQFESEYAANLIFQSFENLRGHSYNEIMSNPYFKQHIFDLIQKTVLTKRPTFFERVVAVIFNPITVTLKYIFIYRTKRKDEINAKKKETKLQSSSKKS